MNALRLRLEAERFAPRPVPSARGRWISVAAISVDASPGSVRSDGQETMAISRRSASVPVPVVHSCDTASLLTAICDDKSRWLATATRLVGDRNAAEDVLQNAFLSALARANELRSPELFSWWFLRVVKNAAIDFRRRSEAYQRVLGRFAHEFRSSTHEDDPLPGVCECVASAFATLSPAYAAILRRIDLDGSPIDQAAREAGISTTNARVRLHRARGTLRSRLIDVCGGSAADNCAPCRCRSARSRSKAQSAPHLTG